MTSPTNDMGRGKAWDIDENELLARAWLAASEDPITGTDQTSKDFFDTVRRRFVERSPPANPTTEGRYQSRSTSSIKQHFGDMSADIQKFRVSLARIHASNPTGVGQQEIVSMAVALHTGRTNVMDYEFKKFEQHNWIHMKGWKVLKAHPKWGQLPTASVKPRNEVNEMENKPGSPEKSSAPSSENDSADKKGLQENNTQGRSTERYNMGSRVAKQGRQEQLRTQAVRTMAESAKRKSDAIEERNAIAAFSRPDASSLPETKEFFTALRRAHLAKALKRARLAEAEASILSSTGLEQAEQADTSPTSENE